MWKVLGLLLISICIHFSHGAASKGPNCMFLGYPDLEYDGEDRTEVLTGKTFNKTVFEDDAKSVVFFNDIEEDDHEYDQFECFLQLSAQILEKRGYKFFTVNTTKEVKLADQEDVEEDEDTIHVYEDGYQIEYHGVRDPENFISWIMDIPDDPLTIINDKDDKREFEEIEDEYIRVIGYFEPGSDALEEFEEAAEEYMGEIEFFAVVDSHWAKKMGLDTVGEVHMYHPFIKEPFEAPLDADTEDELEDWIEDHDEPVLMKLTEDNFFDVWVDSTEDEKMILIFADEEEKEGHAVKKLIKNLARENVEHHGTLEMVLIDPDEFPLMVDVWEEMFDIDIEEGPAIGLVDISEEDGIFFDMAQLNLNEPKKHKESNLEVLQAWIDQVLDGSIDIDGIGQGESQRSPTKTWTTHKKQWRKSYFKKNFHAGENFHHKDGKRSKGGKSSKRDKVSKGGRSKIGKSSERLIASLGKKKTKKIKVKKVKNHRRNNRFRRNDHDDHHQYDYFRRQNFNFVRDNEPSFSIRPIGGVKVATNKTREILVQSWIEICEYEIEYMSRRIRSLEAQVTKLTVAINELMSRSQNYAESAYNNIPDVRRDPLDGRPEHPRRQPIRNRNRAPKFRGLKSNPKQLYKPDVNETLRNDINSNGLFAAWFAGKRVAEEKIENSEKSDTEGKNSEQPNTSVKTMSSITVPTYFEHGPSTDTEQAAKTWLETLLGSKSSREANLPKKRYIVRTMRRCHKRDLSICSLIEYYTTVSQVLMLLISAFCICLLRMMRITVSFYVCPVVDDWRDALRRRLPGYVQRFMAVHNVRI